MSQPLPTGTVAARIQMFQAGLLAGHEQPTLAPSRSSPTPTHMGDSGIIVGRGKRKDPIFASPASRVSRDGAEGMRGDGRPPVSSPSHLLHPSCGEKEVFFRPFSRASRPGTSHESNYPRLTSPQFRHDPDVRDHISATSPIEHVDGTTKLRAIRSRLRSISEVKENEDKEEKKQNLTMDDLETMLDNAIGESSPVQLLPGTNKATIGQQNHKLVTDPHLRQVSGASEQPSWPSQSPIRNTDPPSPKSEAAFELATSFGALDDGGAPLSREDEPHDQLVSIASGTPLREGQDTMKRRSSIFQRYKSRKQQTATGDKGDGVDGHWIHPNSVASDPLSSPVKEKATAFEKYSEKLCSPTLEPISPSDLGTRHRAEWSQYQNTGKQSGSIPARKINHYRRLSYNLKAPRSLIPLELPQILESEKPRGQPIDEVRGVASQTGRLLDDDPGMKERVIAHTNAKNELITKTDPTVASELPAESNTAPSNTEKPLGKDDVTTGELLTQAAAPPREAPNRKSRPSIVESRIQDLMAASKQKDLKERFRGTNNNDIGRVRQWELFEGVASMKPGDSKRLPPLQVPIDEQARAMESMTNTDPRTPTKDTANSKPESLTTRATSPIKPTTIAPATPVRGRSRKVKQSLSPRGIPYAIEQRFSLSPSRSRSRRGESGVFVSVEVRSSPEKTQDGLDEHEVIVRASVEPDDISEETDE